jgi:hypothetical protein
MPLLTVLPLHYCAGRVIKLTDANVSCRLEALALANQIPLVVHLRLWSLSHCNWCATAGHCSQCWYEIGAPILIVLVQPAFGAASTPAFGASTPAFGTAGFGASTPAFGSTGFGAASTPAFGSGSPAPFGSPSATPAFGSSAPAFGAGEQAPSTLHLCKPCAILLGWESALTKACISAMPSMTTLLGMAS